MNDYWITTSRNRQKSRKYTLATIEEYDENLEQMDTNNYNTWMRFNNNNKILSRRNLILVISSCKDLQTMLSIDKIGAAMNIVVNKSGTYSGIIA